jgi:DNA-binding transcriptional MerR regulator
MELSEATGVEARTIRNYIENGLLKGPSSMGRGARYEEEDRERLILIRDLRDRERLTLKEIRHRMASLGAVERAAMASAIAERGEAKRSGGSAFAYVEELLSSAPAVEPRALFRRGMARSDMRLHLEVTPDLEIVWKGLSSPENLARLERIAAYIRTEMN